MLNILSTFNNSTQIYYINIWKPKCVNSISLSLGLTHLGSEASIYYITHAVKYLNICIFRARYGGIQISFFEFFFLI